MDTYSKILETIMGKKGSWSLWLLFNFYLLLNWVQVIGPEMIDFIVILLFGFVFFFLLTGRKKREREISVWDIVFLIGMFFLLGLPLFIPQDSLPFMRFPISKEPYPMYYIFVFFELVLIQNILNQKRPKIEE